jgi:putative DNA primase/helicase
VNAGKTGDGTVVGGAQPPRNTPQQGCTVEQYATAKRLPVEFLRSLGISDYKDVRWENKVLRIPYRDREGNEPAVRIRVELHKRPDGSDERFMFRKGSKHCLYGIWRRGHALARDHAVLAEGESDCHTLWFQALAAGVRIATPVTSTGLTVFT